MGLFSSKSKSSSSSIANEIVTAAEGNNPQPTTITASNQSDAFLENTGIVNRAYKSQQTFNVNRSTADAYTYSTNDNAYNTTTRNSHNITSNDSHDIRKSNYNNRRLSNVNNRRLNNVNNRRYEDSFNRATNSYNRTNNTSNKTVNRTLNDSNNVIGSTIFGRSSSAWYKNTLGAYSRVNSGNTNYNAKDKAIVNINYLPPLFDSSFSESGVGESNFEAINDDTKNMKSNDYRVTGVSESNPFSQTTGPKTTSNSTDQKSDADKLSKYVFIAAVVAGTYMLVSGKKGKGRSSSRGLALR